MTTNERATMPRSHTKMKQKIKRKARTRAFQNRALGEDAMPVEPKRLSRQDRTREWVVR